MRQSAACVLNCLGNWRRFCALLVVLFLARGLFVLSVLPPYEGWDEYQHIAYIEHLAQTGRAPVLHESQVPPSLHPELARFPHSRLGTDQVRRIGGLPYDEFWRAEHPPSPPPEARALPLYQAQQAPLYYRLMLPVYLKLNAAGGLLTVSAGLRLINLIFGAAAVAVALWSVGRLLRTGPHRYIVGLLIATQPLYLLNLTRVANDALAVLCGTIAIAALLALGGRRWWIASTIAGSTLGLAVLTKTNLLGLLPFVLLIHAIAVWRRRLPIGAATASLVIVLALTTAVTYRYFAFNLERYGVLSPLQEAVKNETRGAKATDIWRAALELEWRREFVMRMFRQTLWRGGWSMLSPDFNAVGVNRPLIKIHGFIISASIVAGLLGLLSRRFTSPGVLSDRGDGWALLGLWLGMMAALAYHALHSQLAVGNVGTNAWYGAVIFPWLLALLYAGLAKFPWRWLGCGAAVVFTINQLAAEIYGTFVLMPEAYTGEAWGDLARQRLAFMHIPGIGPEITIPMLFLIVALITAGLAIVAPMIAASESQPGTSSARGRLNVMS